jgi:hypothetical protein
MPTKQTKSETTKFSKTPKNEKVVKTEEHTDDKSKKAVRKPGRTLLLKSASGGQLNSSVFTGLEGLKSHTETKSTSSYFLTFNTVTDAVNAYKKLRNDSSDYRVKYSYYRVFFTMNGLTESSDYNQVKKDLMEHVNKVSGTSVLYCKLYRQDSKFLGCGDFTIDTLDAMNTLLSKESGLKDFTLGSLSGTFYRYNSKKEKSDEHLESSA